MGKMIWASCGFKGVGSSEQCPATAGYRARRGGSTKKEKGPSWDGVFLCWASVLNITWRTTIFLSHIWSGFGVGWTVQTVEF